jgi:hypothetical protein
MIRKFLGFVFMAFLSIVVFVAPCLAQNLGSQISSDQIVIVNPAVDSMRSSPAPAWGTTSFVTHTVQILDFLPPNSSVTWGTMESSTDGIAVYQTSSAQVDWWAPVFLPSGALVTSIELEACDYTATGLIYFGMARGTSPSGTAANVSFGSTGVAETPGCSFFPQNLYAPITVDNDNNDYWLFVAWSGDYSSSSKVKAIRVFYNLQISPAPGIATFNDVPTTHPLFQYIEALAASGITTGYDDDTFRPSQYITRGQMAVFMSRALGLHWPN